MPRSAACSSMAANLRYLRKWRHFAVLVPPPVVSFSLFMVYGTGGVGGVSLCFLFVCLLPVSVLLPPPSPARRAHPLFPKKGEAYPAALRVVCCLTFTAWRVQRWGSLDELPQPASSLNRNKLEMRHAPVAEAPYAGVRRDAGSDHQTQPGEASYGWSEGSHAVLSM